MKFYQITLSVPDDFIPEEMALSVAYDNGTIVVASEGFVSAESVEAANDSIDKDSQATEDESTPDSSEQISDSVDQVEAAVTSED